MAPVVGQQVQFNEGLEIRTLDFELHFCITCRFKVHFMLESSLILLSMYVSWAFEISSSEFIKKFRCKKAHSNVSMTKKVSDSNAQKIASCRSHSIFDLEPT